MLLGHYAQHRIVAGFIAMMNPYFSFSTLIFGISAPVSTTVSPTAALTQGWCTDLSGGYGLDLGLRYDDLAQGNDLLMPST